MPTELVFLQQFNSDGSIAGIPKIDPVVSALDLNTVYEDLNFKPNKGARQTPANTEFLASLAIADAAGLQLDGTMNDYEFHDDGLFGVVNGKYNMYATFYSHNADSRNLLAYYSIDRLAQTVPDHLRFYYDARFSTGAYSLAQIEENSIAARMSQRRNISKIPRLTVITPNSCSAIRGHDQRLANNSCPVRVAKDPNGSNILIADPRGSNDHAFNDSGVVDEEIAIGFVVIQNGWDLLQNGTIGGEQIDLLKIVDHCRFSDLTLNCYIGCPPIDVIYANLVGLATGSVNSLKSLYDGYYWAELESLPLHYSTVPVNTETDNDIMEPRRIVAIEDTRLNAVPNRWTVQNYRKGESVEGSDGDYSDLMMVVKFTSIEIHTNL
jgi:hypothetical protein